MNLTAKAFIETVSAFAPAKLEVVLESSDSLHSTQQQTVGSLLTRCSASSRPLCVSALVCPFYLELLGRESLRLPPDEGMDSGGQQTSDQIEGNKNFWMLLF